METMDDLISDFLQDIYYAEKLGVRSMAKMMRAAQSAELKAAVEEHRTQSQDQIKRIEHVFEILGHKRKQKVCAAMEGLVEEAEEAIKESKKGPVLDAALIACAQAIEHYEIARYGAIAAWARTAGQDEAADILHEIMEEEKVNDEKLNELAESLLNPQAKKAGDEHEEDEDEEAEHEAEEDNKDAEAKQKLEEHGESEDAPKKPAPKRRAAARAKK